MNYHFHPEAEEEFLGAIDWYEEHEENLGFDFAERSTPLSVVPQSVRGLGPFSKGKCGGAK